MKLKQLSYKKRFRLILIGCGLFALAIYNFALADTLTLYQKKSELVDRINIGANATEELAMVKAKLSRLENIVGQDAPIAFDAQQHLLESVTQYSEQNDIMLTAFPHPFSIIDEGYLVQTSVITVEGEFTSLLKLCHYLENNYHSGRVVSLNFEASTELRTRKRKLNSTIYLQHIKNQSNEESI